MMSNENFQRILTGVWVREVAGIEMRAVVYRDELVETKGLEGDDSTSRLPVTPNSENSGVKGLIGLMEERFYL
jgi:hypothetical protein